MSMFLSDDELEELTGKVRHDAQRRELARRGWIFEVTASGRPIVSRSYAEAKLGRGHATAEPTRLWRPNFDALKKTG